MQHNQDDGALKTDFLAAYHSLLFSKTTSNEIDVERRRLVVKYMTARKFESEDAAALLLSQGLKQYQSVIEKTGFLKKINPPARENASKWTSSLKDASRAISLVKPLPCQRRSSDAVCGRRELVDRDVENLMKISDDDKETIVRKAPSAPQRVPPRGYSRFEQESSSSVACDRPQSNFVPRNQQRPFPIEENSPSAPFFNNSTPAESRPRNHHRPDFERSENNDYSRKNHQSSSPGSFRTAKAELHIQQQQKQTKKSLGGKAAINSQFVCPFKRDADREEEKKSETPSKTEEPEDERLRGIDAKLIELVRNEIMDSGTFVSWNDVAGLEHAKKIIKEIVVLPMLRPDIFTGLRRPPKGILLFGPPGTGKTLIGKCIASQSKSTFFSISASSLTSKWIGEGEKMVRALFAVARVHQPSVIFIDEIDSLLTQRSETEHESSRRIKTEFLVQLDGAATGEEDRILVIGATNRPQELDEAARRRFVKRLYVPLPEYEARRQIVENLLAAERHDLNDRDIDRIANLSEHYSGADMTNLCKEASMGPIRSIPFELLENIRKEDVRCVTAEDFNQALSFVRPSVSQSDLGLYINWDRTYGSGMASVNSPKPP